MLCTNNRLFLCSELVSHALSLHNQLIISFSEEIELTICHDFQIMDPHIICLEIDDLGFKRRDVQVLGLLSLKQIHISHFFIRKCSLYCISLLTCLFNLSDLFNGMA